MAARAPVVAHDNIFNRSVLGENGNYFNSLEDIVPIIKKAGEINFNKINKKNMTLISNIYKWENISG